MTIKQLLDSSVLSGKASFGPQHYATAANIDWHTAKSELQRYADLGILIALSNGQYRITPPKASRTDILHTE